MPPSPYAGHTTVPTTAVPKTKPPGLGKRFLMFVLAVAVGAGVGWLGLQAWALVKPDTSPAPAGAAVAPVSPAPATAPGSVAAPAPAAVGFQATLIMGDRRFDLGADQVALPSGSRFQIGVESPYTGLLTIRTVNPQGVASDAPLWSGRVVVGQKITTDTLRLEGSKGRETLLLHIRPENGAAPVTRSVHLWHL